MTLKVPFRDVPYLICDRTHNEGIMTCHENRRPTASRRPKLALHHGNAIGIKGIRRLI